MAKRTKAEAKQRLRDAKNVVKEIEGVIADYEKGRERAASRAESEKFRKLIYGLKRKLAAAKAELKRAKDVAYYFDHPEIREKQREASRLLMRALRERRRQATA